MNARSRLAKATLLMTALAFTAYAAEGVLRMLAPEDWRTVQKRRIAAAGAANVAFDTRSPLQVIQDLRARGVMAYPAIKPFNFLHNPLTLEGRKVLPLAGIANVLTVFNANETGEYLVYESDEHGFHNPRGMHRRPIEVAVLGDSYVHGVAVRSGEGLVARIREQIPRTLNLGMGASGPLTELAILTEYAQPVQPRVVVWAYYEGNDQSDLVKENRVKLLRAYLNGHPAPWLRQRQRQLDRELVRFAEELIKCHSKPVAQTPPPKPPRKMGFLRLTELRARVSLAFSPGSRADRDERLVQLRRVLQVARTRVERWEGRFYFVYLPEYARFSPRWTLSADARRRQEVLATVAELGIATIDVSEVFAAYAEPTELFPFGQPGHYNAMGYSLVADAVVRVLEDEAALASAIAKGP
jgi:hypothetical protein